LTHAKLLDFLVKKLKLDHQTTKLQPFAGQDFYWLSSAQVTGIICTPQSFQQVVFPLLKSELLDNFKYVRALYHSNQQIFIMDSLQTTAEKAQVILEEHYGPFSYSYYESAFDEYVTSLIKNHGIEIKDDLILAHAGVDSIDQIKAKGYMNKYTYVNDMVEHQDREQMLVQSGGISYKEWLQREIKRFTQTPKLMLTELNAVFENIFPDTVWIDKEAFVNKLQDLPARDMVQIVSGPQSQIQALGQGDFLISTNVNNQIANSLQKKLA
jgi:hypothetical protein